MVVIAEAGASWRRSSLLVRRAALPACRAAAEAHMGELWPAPPCFPEPRIEAHSPLFATLVLSVTHPDKPTSRSTRWHVEMRTTGPPAATRCLDVPPLLPSHSPTALSGRHGSGSLSLPPNPGTSRSRQAVRPGRRASAPQVAERRERRSRRRERRASAPRSRACVREPAAPLGDRLRAAARAGVSACA